MQCDGKWLQVELYHKYSSSQTYFYSNKINEIVKERRTAVKIFYEDIEYLSDGEENMKRWYHGREFGPKMAAFKEYYFYHQDCPRVFMKGIQIAYTKWQNRKRDLVYKKLKMIYNESYSSCNIDTQANKDRDSKNESVGSNFLLEISDYNPYSKKYYLRVQARKEKEELARKEEEKRNRSRRDIEYLSHELSRMLRDLGELSMISTLGDTPRKDDMYKNPAGKKGSGRNLSNLSNSSSLIKFNFKKNKVSQEKLVELPNRKTVLRESPKDKAKDPILRLSPKFLMTNQNQPQPLKAKSIFSVSTFGALNKKLQLKAINSKRELLKLNYGSKKNLKEDSKRYESEKKKESKEKIVKSKSNVKLEMKPQLEKLKIREISIGKMQSHTDEFSDKRMAEASQFRRRSHKSEFTGSKKTLLQVKPHQFDHNRKVLELGHW